MCFQKVNTHHKPHPESRTMSVNYLMKGLQGMRFCLFVSIAIDGSLVNEVDFLHLYYAIYILFCLLI